MNSTDRIKYSTIINSLKLSFSIKEIEAILVNRFLVTNNINLNLCKQNILINQVLNHFPLKYYDTFDLDLNINNFEELEYMFESLLTDEFKSENGVVFTPEYIVDFIISLCKNDNQINYNKEVSITSIENEQKTFLDPACGCGAFLRGATVYIKNIFPHLSYKNIIENYIYGVDIEEDNIHRCKIILTLQCIINNEFYNSLNFNLEVADTLKTDLNKLFNKPNGFKYIIGNPPYANPHDLDKEVTTYIKKNFLTTKTGTTNIFYAFIEHSIKFLNNYGELVFIVPNNFLTINAAKSLRKFLINNNYLDTIIDFKDNIIFNPIRTYNCIIKLNTMSKDKLKYSVLPKCDNIKNELNNIDYSSIKYNALDENGWKLLDKHDSIKISQIEKIGIPIKKFIRTGIATLKDDAYILDGYCETNNKYYKFIDNKQFFIEKDLVKPLYKISAIKSEYDIESYKKYILFPYEHGDDKKYKIISEEKLSVNFPEAYMYLNYIKELLSTRDGGKPNSVKWYAYGRTQGLNKYGRKLLYPTFSNKPKFRLINDEDVLFCNGYAIFENDYIELEILSKVLNSIIMEFYVEKTSYSMEGGYFCYQKKFIEKFSIPSFTENEIQFIRNTNNKQELDNFFMKKYGVTISYTK